MQREIKQTITINNIPDKVFNALLNPTAIIEWWQAKTAIVVKEDNGIYAISWGDNLDDPEYVSISNIKNFTPNSYFSLDYTYYSSKHGNLPFVTEMMVEFKINPVSESSARLEVKQTGIPDAPIADAYYEGCVTGWNQVLNNIRNYCEKV